VNGASVASGHASAAIPVHVGVNNITIAVTAPDGATQDYTVAVSVVAAPACSLSTTSSVSGSAGGGYTLTITVTNNGSGTVNGITLDSATLGSASGSPVPQSLGGTGTLAASASNSFSVGVPGSAGADGSGVAEKYSGTANAPCGGGFAGSVRSVTLP
jgi:hypothetical protein